jgi:saccharopine dehydrogenase-like NADP-dependent oxidoreductase
MKKILILGAGLVSRPLVEYFEKELSDCPVTLADINREHLEKAKQHYPSIEIALTDLEDKQSARELITKHDIVISLLPNVMHPRIARICLQEKKHLVTASYVSPEMEMMDADAKKAGICFINEVGLDPGLDHMSTKKIIDRVHAKGGNILSIKSYAGGLPAPEANTNPIGYKFSWSPFGVLKAAKSGARYLENGKMVFVPGRKLFYDYHHINIPGLGSLEAYPNRDSIPYINRYDVHDVITFIRGTLRNPGWCRLWQKLIDLNLLEDFVIPELNQMTFREFISMLINEPDPELARQSVASYLRIREDDEVIQILDWLGFFSDDKIPLRKAPIMHVFQHQLERKLSYDIKERDMVIVYHEIVALYMKERRRELISSQLLHFGDIEGNSAMAKTVSLPVAIATQLLVEDKIQSRGVLIPTLPELYEPILKKIKQYGIQFIERVKPI